MLQINAALFKLPILVQNFVECIVAPGATIEGIDLKLLEVEQVCIELQGTPFSKGRRKLQSGGGQVQVTLLLLFFFFLLNLFQKRKSRKKMESHFLPKRRNMAIQFHHP